jgi:hypothetical protein
MMQNLMENPNPRSEFLKNESFAGVSSILARIEHKKDFDGFHQVKDRLQSFVAGSKEVLGRGGGLDMFNDCSNCLCQNLSVLAQTV